MPSCRPFFFNDTATTEIYTLSLHDALPIYVGPLKIPETMNLDNAVLLTDVVPTGYQAAEMGGIKKGDTVVVFGAGPVGIMAAKCSWLFGAGRVIVIDQVEIGRASCRERV